MQGRYEALLGPNTKQFWLYDNKNDTFIDPPTEVLREIDAIAYPHKNRFFATADTYSAAERRLEEIAATDPDWLHDGYEYPSSLDI